MPHVLLSFLLNITHQQKRHLLFNLCKVNSFYTLFIKVSLTFQFIMIILVTLNAFNIGLVYWLCLICYKVVASTTSSSFSLRLIFLMLLVFTFIIITFSSRLTLTFSSTTSSFSSTWCRVNFFYEAFNACSLLCAKMAC